MKKLLLSILLASVLFTQDASNAADFLFLDNGARSTASGNAFFVGQGDIAAYRYFPADYTLNTERKVYSVISTKFDGLVKQIHAGYSQPLLGGLNIALNYNFSGVTDIPKFEKLVLDETDNTPRQKTPSAFFDYSNHIVTLTFGKVFDNIVDVGWDYFTIPIRMPVALNVNYLRSSLYEYNANAYTLDLSFGLQFNLGEFLRQEESLGDVTFFFNAMNFAGSKLSWDIVQAIDGSGSTESFEAIDNNFTTGINFISSIEKVKMKIGFSYQHQSRYSDDNFGMMFEYDDFVEFRFGLSEGQFTSGLGVKAYNGQVFVSLKPKHDLGKNILIDLSYDF